MNNNIKSKIITFNQKLYNSALDIKVNINDGKLVINDKWYFEDIKQLKNIINEYELIFKE